jgi:ABC-type glycerol-3-phosphate transport system permease component
MRTVSTRMRARTVGAVFHVAIICVCALFVLPFYWVAISALRPLAETTAFPVKLIPSSVTLDHFRELLTTTNFLRTLINSVIVATVTAIGASIICSLAGYAFALLRFRGRDALFAIVLATILLPPTILMVPNYYLFAKMGILDTWWTLILPTVAPAIGILWMRQYIRAAIPVDLTEAARVDGCSEFAIYWRIILPLSRPGIAALAIFITVQSWNDFVLPFLYLTTPDKLTFPARLIQFVPTAGQYQTRYDLIMAGAVLSALPMLALYAGLQRHFVAGITLGSDR